MHIELNEQRFNHLNLRTMNNQTIEDVKTLIEAIIAKGLPCEAYSNVATGKTWVGLNTNPRGWVWSWFSGSSLSDDSIVLFFDHTYNQNTGRIIKSWKTGYNLRLKLEKLIGISL